MQSSIGVDGFADETNVYFVADLFISITDFFGDLILIYRCWHIWNRNVYVIILPLLTSLGGLSKSARLDAYLDVDRSLTSTCLQSQPPKSVI